MRSLAQSPQSLLQSLPREVEIVVLRATGPGEGQGRQRTNTSNHIADRTLRAAMAKWASSMASLARGSADEVGGPDLGVVGDKNDGGEAEGLEGGAGAKLLYGACAGTGVGVGAAGTNVVGASTGGGALYGGGTGGADEGGQGVGGEGVLYGAGGITSGASRGGEGIE